MIFVAHFMLSGSIVIKNIANDKIIELLENNTRQTKFRMIYIRSKFFID